MKREMRNEKSWLLMRNFSFIFPPKSSNLAIKFIKEETK